MVGIGNVYASKGDLSWPGDRDTVTFDHGVTARGYDRYDQPADELSGLLR